MTPFTPDDLHLHQKVSTLHCVDGHGAAVGAVRSVDRDNDGYHSSLWLFSRQGEARRLTHGPGKDTAPQLSPDGKRVAFLSTRGGGAPQPQLMPLRGGEARPVGELEMGAVQLRWSHDGRALLATAAQPVDPDGRGRRGGPASRREGREPEVCWRLPYKSDGVGYQLAREIHLFRIDPRSGETQRLTDGPFDVSDFAPSPDGRAIAYVRSREGRYAHRTDLWLCESDCNRHRRLTDGHAMVAGPAWSPDSRWIAFAGAVREGDAQMRPWLLECATGQVRPLGPAGLEVADSDSLHWRADGAALVLVRAQRGRHEVVRITVDGGALETLVAGDRQIGAFTTDGSDFFFSAETPVRPSEVICRAVAGGEERQVGRLNAWWDSRPALTLQSRRFDVPDGNGGKETIEGWLLHAADAQGPMPLLDDVHGGPASYALLDFDTNVYWQSLCSRGWAVLVLNAVGSASYGDAFCERLAGRWGDLDLPQHLAAVRQLQSEGLCDERAAIAGKSYGGFLTAWAVGHSDTFQAAVVMSPVGNIETHYGTSDGGYYADPLYLDTAPVFDRQRARELSPLRAIERATTPTLFLQGKDDERTPKCQSEELFVSLYRAGQATTELVLYPGEGHTFLGEGQPHCRSDAARRIIDWVVRHAGHAGHSARPAVQAVDTQHRHHEDAVPAASA